jgi:hypothetical protein
MSKVLTDIRLIFCLPRDMEIPVKLLIMVRKSNVGAIFMAKNVSYDVSIRQEHFKAVFNQDSYC